MTTNAPRALPSPDDLSQAQFDNLRRICFGKSYRLSTQDREDVFSDHCERAVRKFSIDKSRDLADVIGNNVYWKTGGMCQSVRARSERVSTIDDQHFAAWSSTDGQIEAVEISALVDDLLSSLPAHLVSVGRRRADNDTNDEIAADIGIPRGTVQYHFESFQRKAKAHLARLGINSLDDIYFPSVPSAA